MSDAIEAAGGIDPDRGSFAIALSTAVTWSPNPPTSLPTRSST
jgi:hypothetical protein